jgi:glycosyltransferase involved in cell wall biosynthesis
MLIRWALEQRFWKKRIAWHTYQCKALQGVSVFHATSEDEASELRALGFRQPIAIIPNAVNVPPRKEKRELLPRQQRRALFMSRLHPNKGLPLLIEAWSQVRPPQWILDVAGPDEDGHLTEMKRLVAARGLEREISFVGEVADADKWNVYAGADLFILPSHSENFGIAIAEALASAVPVITTTRTPWQSLRDVDGGWWVEPDVARIAAALQDATARSAEQLLHMGQRGRRLIEERFSWRRVAEEMTTLYGWICQKEPKPKFVSLG